MRVPSAVNLWDPEMGTWWSTFLSCLKGCQLRPSRHCRRLTILNQITNPPALQTCNVESRDGSADVPSIRLEKADSVTVFPPFNRVLTLYRCQSDLK